MSKTMETIEEKIMNKLLEFYSHTVNFKQILDIVVLKTRYMPLRTLDWFTTNYAKKRNISYNIKRPNGSIQRFKVYRSYKSQLKGCKKKDFDPFCRGDTITLKYESPIDGTEYEFDTAICQLNFFKWAIENLVLDYVEQNFDSIYNDMKTNNSKSQKTDDQEEGDPNEIDEIRNRKRKTELSQSIHKTMCTYDALTTLQFSAHATICT